jgi:hypothetical protein
MATTVVLSTSSTVPGDALKEPHIGNERMEVN